MIDIGINYITEKNENKYDHIYEFLIKNNYINTIKFPGKYCDYVTLEYAFNLINKYKFKMDIHGLPNMVPAIYSSEFIKNIEWEQLIQKNLPIKRISTHMGLENKEKIESYGLNVLDERLKENIKNVKCKFKKLLGYEIEVGLENIPGGFEFDKKTITPEFISKNYEMADFGVFDIAHAKISANQLGITYHQYLEKIKRKNKVKILHVAGNIDKTGKYNNKPDKHVLIDESEISDIIDTIKQFKNLDLIVSEYAYNSLYSYEKELIIEAITLNKIVNTMNVDEVKNTMKYLKKNIKSDSLDIKGIRKDYVK